MAILSTLWAFLQELLSFLLVRTYDTVKFLFHQGYRDGRNRIPDLDKNFLSYPATKLAAMIRDKELSSEELVRSVIHRIQQVQPMLNALVDNRFGAALEEARKCDEEVASFADIEELARSKPFLGVPFTVKDSIPVEGLLFELCYEGRRGLCADSDATCVSRMKAAGAIVMGTTNVPEMCLWVESSNHLHGRTNNPFDLHRTCGGSSGGEGALISACGSVWGIGADMAGSIRIPATWCGLFGHKATPHLLSREGLVSDEGEGFDSQISVVGPMTRSADDLVAMVKVLADEPQKLRLDDPVDVSSLRYFFCDHEGTSFISAAQPEVRKQVHRVVNFVKHDLNVKAEPLPEPEKLGRGVSYFYAFMAEYNFAATEMSFSEENNWTSWIELLKHATGFSSHTLPSILSCLVDAFYRRDLGKCREDFEEFVKYKQRLYDLLGEDGVLILPSSVSVAPFHHGTICQPALYFGLAGLINVLQLPSTVVPMGLDSRGMPLSVQIVASHGQDRLTLSVAKELEKKFGGFVPPCKFPKQPSN